MNDVTMKVALINYTPDPDRTGAAAARLCYSAAGAEELVEKMSDEQVEKLLTKIVDMGHYSTLEHSSFTFAIEGVSRALTHQLVRHRIASYNQQSQRYVKESAFDYVIPPAIASNPEMKAKYIAHMATVQTFYNELLESGIHREDARYILPNGAETKIVVTMNARSLLHFFELRCCTRAQLEIRLLAEKMLAEVRKVAPVIFAKGGPTCVSQDLCNEGEMTCGRLEALRAAKARVSL